jgi:CDP-glucose 4,6-dehydratase
VAGYIRLADALLGGLEVPHDGGFNFGPAGDDAQPVSRVADALVASWSDGARWERDPAVHPYEARLLEVDSSRARSVLGWSPKWPLDEGLARTVDWYRAVALGEDARAVTLAQIEDHLDG